MTPSTRATISSGRWRLFSATASVQPPSMSTHSSIEPSCEPHVAAIRYCERQLRVRVGRDVERPRSRWRRTSTRGSRTRTRRTGTAPRASGRASAIHAAMPRCAPTSGSVPSSAASSSARISAKCPSSGIIGSVLCVIASASWRPCPSPPACAPGRPRRRPRAACSSRRAWPAPRSRGTRRRARSCPARRRLCPP